MAQEKVRLSFEMPPSVKEQLEGLLKRSRCASMSEVVRKALAVFDLVLELQEENVKLITRRTNGEEETLRII